MGMSFGLGEEEQEESDENEPGVESFESSLVRLCLLRVGLGIGPQQPIEGLRLFWIDVGGSLPGVNGAVGIADLPENEFKRALLWVPGFVTSRDR